MKISRFIFAAFILEELIFSWPLPQVNAQDYYTTQDEQNKKVLKQGLMGAGVGAIASGTSGGNAGKGALIGAGTNVIGSALIDTLTTSQTPPQPQPQVQYVQQAPERVYETSVPAPPRRSGCGGTR